MLNFGKFKSFPQNVELPPAQIGIDEEGNPIFGSSQTVNVLFFRDASGRDICDIAKENPFKYYIAVDDAGFVFSMTDDIEQSQIAGADIIGIDEDFGFTSGPGGTVYGKLWNGTAIVEPPVIEPVPDDISRRQFFQQLFVLEIITKPEALTAIPGLNIPPPLQAIIDQLPTQSDRDSAEMLVIGAQNFNRLHPLSETVRLSLGWSVEQKDDFWREASKL